MVADCNVPRKKYKDTVSCWREPEAWVSQREDDRKVNLEACIVVVLFECGLLELNSKVPLILLAQGT